MSVQASANEHFSTMWTQSKHALSVKVADMVLELDLRLILLLTTSTLKPFEFFVSFLHVHAG